MDNVSLERMMQAMEIGKKSGFQISVVLTTILLMAALLAVLLVNGFGVYFFKVKGFKIFRICSVILLACYLALLVSHWHYYKFGDQRKNQGPWRYGIYEAYYECAKCKGLAGGIFGKGPTKWSIVDTECVHNWQAVFPDDFARKIKERTEVGNAK